jgi:DNA-binding transcriptional LysR family regulator
LSVLNSADVIKGVAESQFDLGFVETPVLSDQVCGLQVGTDPLALAVPPSHRWASGDRTVDVSQLPSAGLLLREQGSGTRETVDRELRLHGQVIQPALELASNPALKEAAVQGMGPVVLSRRALRLDLESGRLVEIQVSGVGFERPLTGVWRHRQRLSNTARILLDLAREAE